jgi:aminobenzoyl-glutamate utilization protein B
MFKLVERVKAVAEGAAMMTGTTVRADFVSAMSEMLDNPPLYELMHGHMAAVGPADFDEDDLDYARRMQATLSDEEIDAAYQAAGVAPRDTPICDFVMPLEARGVPMLGSTDLGDVSWTVPFAQLGAATYAIGTPGHTWQITAQGKTQAAHKVMVQVAKAIAGTAADLLADPRHLRAAKADHAERLARQPYRNPLTPDAEPRVP